eukprot:scaffold2011_cov26-Cyclotella_meneghiniana.AAC.4
MSSPHFFCVPHFLTPFSVPSITLGKLECIEEVVGLEGKDMLALQQGPYTSYGTCGDSLNLMSETWHGLEHVFSIHGPHPLSSSPAIQGRYHYVGPRHSVQLLNHHPVDLLIIECGRWQCPRPPLDGQRWELMIHATALDSRPKTIIEIWPPNSLLWELGPSGKASRVRWESLGYTSKMKVIDPQHCGGAIVQPRAIIVRHSLDNWVWAPYSSLSAARPMQNLLIPKGLRPRRKLVQPPNSDLPSFDRDPMPGKPPAWIVDVDGPRQLFPTETAKALGAPNSLLGSQDHLTPKLLSNSSSIFHFEYLSQCFLLQLPEHQLVAPTSAIDTAPSLDSPADNEVFPEWCPPDMSPGGAWHTARLERLRFACSHYDNSDELFQQGLDLLAIHRQNYDDTGPAPKRLQLLWWEFPQSKLG